MTSPKGGALVTGGSKRVGRALCLALAQSGYCALIHYRSGADDALALVEEIRAAGGSADALDADLSAVSDLPALVRRAASTAPLTLLVNNASHFGTDSIETLSEASWNEHIGPNLLAPLFLSQTFAEEARRLPADQDASIINILDQRVLRPNPQFFSYTLSKSALYTATMTLAQALAPRIRVNAVGPGPTLPSIHQTQADFDAEVEGLILKRQTAIPDLTAAVLFLASATSVTGQLIAVDGGQHLGWRTPDIIGP